MKRLLQGRPLGHPLHVMLVHLPIALWLSWTQPEVFVTLLAVALGGADLVAGHEAVDERDSGALDLLGPELLEPGDVRLDGGGVGDVGAVDPEGRRLALP